MLKANKQEIKQGEEVIVTVSLEESKVTACNFSIYFDSTKLEFIKDANNINVIDNEIKYVWFDNLGGRGAKKGDIQTFKFIAKENGLATFTIEGEFYNQNEQLIQTDFNEVQVQIGKEETNLQTQVEEPKETIEENANTNLEILAIENILLNPPFDAIQTEYKAEIPNSAKSLNIFAVPENEKASVEIIGKDDLKEGKNIVTVIVKSENGKNEKKYIVEVNRRNEEAEKEYQEEQSKQVEKLENAYNIEKTSTSVNIEKETTYQNFGKEKKDIEIWIIEILIAILIVSFAIWKKKKK